MTHVISDAEAELINECLLFIYNYPAPRDLERVFISESKGIQHRVEVLMVDQGLIELVDSLRIGHKSARITNKGNRIIVNHGSFMKYLEHELEKQNEIKRKEAESEAREERNTIANEKNAKSSKMIVFLTTLTVVISAIAVWQTQKNNEKDKVIEIQKNHIQQLENRISKMSASWNTWQ